MIVQLRQQLDAWPPPKGGRTALRMGTIWAARYIGEEKNLGSIEKGKKADLVVLGADYLTVPEDQMSDISVVATVVGGKVVYGEL